MGPAAGYLDRLAAFTWLWACAGFFHQLSDTHWVDGIGLFGWPVTVLCLVCMALPRWLPGFITLLVLTVAHTVEKLPFVPNHILLELVINATILMAFNVALLRHDRRRRPRPGSPDRRVFRETFYNTFAPVLRLELLVLYFFAVLHKLNYSYFDPRISCSVELINTFGPMGIFFPRSPLMDGIAIYGTLLIEAAIPVMLFLRWTRLFGLILGLGFHFMLGLHANDGIYSFSSLVFALYFVFLPPSFMPPLNQGWQALRRRLGRLSEPRVAGSIAAGLALSLVAAATVVLLTDIDIQVGRVGQLIWIAWAVGLAYLFGGVVLKRPGIVREPERRAIFVRRSAVLWCMPVFLLLNGLSPYLGLKTQTSFAMFSNLRTEDYSNHLFMPQINLTNMQQELVRIHDSDRPELRHFSNRDLLLPYFEFRRILQRLDGDFTLEYTYQGQRQTAYRKGADTDHPELFEPAPLLMRKLIMFRSIDSGAYTHCRH